MNNKLTIGVIPAAGKGTRFGYLSHVLPKALLPLYNRPIIHHVIDHMVEVGIKEIYIIVNFGKVRIKEYCTHIPLPYGTKIHFIEQNKLEGLASAILLTEKYIKDKPFLVILGDDCTISNSFPSMVDYFLQSDAVALEAVVKEKDKKILRQTNSVKIGKNNQIAEIIEKPKDPLFYFRGCGIYLFRSEIFSYIKRTPVSSIRNEREITHTLQMITKSHQVNYFLIKGLNININNYDDLLSASLEIKKLIRI